MAWLQSEYTSSNRLAAFPFSQGALPLLEDDPLTAASSGLFPSGAVLDALFTVHRGAMVDENDQFELVEATSSGTLVFRINGENITFNIPAQLAVGGVVYGTKAGVTHGKLVVHPDLRVYMDALTSNVVFSSPLPLEARAVVYAAPRVNRLAKGGEHISGDITLAAGHNMAIGAEGNRVRLDVVPGGGTGREKLDPITGGLPPLRPDSNGNIELTGDACYSVSTDKNSGTIFIQSTCDPCCDCDDYVELLNRLSTLLAAIDALKGEYMDTVELYNEEVEEYNTVLYPKYRKLDMWVKKLESSEATGSWRHWPVQAVIRNRTEWAHSGTATVSLGAGTEFVVGHVQHIRPGIGDETTGFDVSIPFNGSTFSFGLPPGGTVGLHMTLKGSDVGGSMTVVSTVHEETTTETLSF